MIKYVLFLFLAISCSSQDKIIQENNLSASYEAWVAGVRGGGSGITFFVDLNIPLENDIELKRVIFRGYEALFKKQDALHFAATIITAGNQQKTAINEGQTSIRPPSTATLAENEAILIFSINGKEVKQTIKKVKEKPMLQYPSVKPKF